MRVVALAMTYPVADLREADVVTPTLAKIEVICRPGSDGEPRIELSVPGSPAG